MIWKVRGLKQLVEQLIRCVLDHLHLFDDDFLFLCQIVFIEAGMQEQIGQQIEGAFQLGVDNLHRKAGHLVGRIRVELTAQTIRFRGDFVSRTAVRAFEKRVLDEVTDAVQRR